MLNKYFEGISIELDRKSKEVREFFASHKPSAGANREEMVSNFLKEYIPKKYAVSSGLILSKNGTFSNQADIIIADQMSNAPLFGGDKEKIWLVESVYSLIEVKTQLTPTTLRDSIEKCRRFKLLPREFASDFGRQNIRESLFILWAFEGPSPEKIKENLITELRNIPRHEQPDFIVVPGSTLVSGSHYFELSSVNKPDPQSYAKQLAECNGNIDTLLDLGFEVTDMGSNTLLTWLVMYLSWLHAAGERRALLESYLPQNITLGRVV